MTNRFMRMAFLRRNALLVISTHICSVPTLSNLTSYIQSIEILVLGIVSALKFVSQLRFTVALGAAEVKVVLGGLGAAELSEARVDASLI